MNLKKQCKSDATPTRIRFARPRCFCGHVAAAIYPEPDPWSDPMPLTANWVYECHYTPKQEGMVTPDHCYGCDEELARALRARDVNGRESRMRGPSRENDSNVGTLANYYNPDNIHNADYHSSNSDMLHDGWAANPQSSAYGHSNTSDQQISFLSSHKKSSRQSWADTVRRAKAQWDAESFHHNVARGDYAHISVEEHEFISTNEPSDLYTSPESFPTSAWGKQPTRGTSNPANISTYADIDSSYFNTAVPQPTNATNYHNSPNYFRATVGSDRTYTGIAAINAQVATEASWRGPPAPRVKVCGFHMHALEWQKIDNIKMDKVKVIALVERARCPKFNLSITRWLNQGFNHLEMEPFNIVKCYCGNATIVAKDHSRKRYELVCRNRYAQSTSIPSRHLPHRNSNNGSSSHWNRVSCSKAIPIDKVVYRPLVEPVHQEIPSDDWLSRFFPYSGSLEDYNDQGSVSAPKVLVSILKKEEIGSFSHYSRQRIIGRKTLTFRDPISETIHLPVPPPILMTSQEFGTGECFIPKLLDDSETTFALKILFGEQDVDMSDETFARKMDTAGVYELPAELVRITIKEGCRDADDYLQANEERMRQDLQQYIKKQGELDTLVDAAIVKHAQTVEKIQTMESNAQLLPELKCRVCYDAQIKFAILPCHHMVLCAECAQIVPNCIVCRGPKLGILRIDFG
ncbi:hypothetical protein FBU30_006404 [Linnemannia zychae]|nr:hypothetical protein FBU30_006404 [Linnemannia zychae]